MNPRTTLLLFIVVAGLGLLVWRQTEREDPDHGIPVVPLLEGLEQRHVRRIRVDHLERSQHMEFRRDTGGRWYLTDPIAYPARKEMLDQLFGALRNDAYRVSSAELEGVDTGLDPPRIVLEVTETLPSGQERSRVLEIGSVDLDGMTVYVRQDDVVYRTLRNLETPLELHHQEWRSRSIFDLESRAIVRIDRQGFDFTHDGQTSLNALAERRGPNWWLDRPQGFFGDPLAMGAWSQMMATLTVDRFRSDIDEPDLAVYGLDNPWFQLTLTDRTGNSQTLLVAGNHAKREDLPYVWELHTRESSQLRQDLRELFDGNLARVFRREIDRVTVLGDSTLRLTQDQATERWTVEHTDPTGEWTVPVPANPEVVDQVLRTFEQTEIVGYLWDLPVEDVFRPQDPGRGLWLESSGLRYGGRVGGVHESEQGTETLYFLREGERAVSLVPTEVEELLHLTPLDVESLALWELEDVRLRQLTIAREGGEERVYERKVQGTWVHEDTPELPAKEIFPIIDQMVFLRAERHYPRDAAVELSDVVRVTFQGADGVSQAEIGVTADGETRVSIGGRQSRLRTQELHGMLLEVVK